MLYLGTTPKAASLGEPRRPRGIGSTLQEETQLVRYIEEDEESKKTKLMVQKLKDEAHSSTEKSLATRSPSWFSISEILASASSQRRTAS